jgi:hypothetical protein
MQGETRTHLQIVSIIAVKLQLELKRVDKFHQTTQMLKLMGEVFTHCRYEDAKNCRVYEVHTKYV